MGNRGRWTALVAATLYVAIAACRQASPAPAPDRARVALATELPPLDGRQLRTTIVEVSYGPGEASPPHSHPCPVLVYVVAGALRTQLRGEPDAVYTAGQTFYEASNGVHAISANASADEPARFVAFFVCDRDTTLSVPVPEP